MPFLCFLLLVSYSIPNPGSGRLVPSLTPGKFCGDLCRSTSFSYQFSKYSLDRRMNTDMLWSSGSSCLVNNHMSGSLSPPRVRCSHGLEPCLIPLKTLRHGAGWTQLKISESTSHQLSASAYTSLPHLTPSSAPLSSGPSDTGPHIFHPDRSMMFGLQSTGPTVGSHLKNKESWPFQGKTKADFSPVDPFSFKANSMQTPGPPPNYI